MSEILAVGCDLGTMFLQGMRDDGAGGIVINEVRDCYREVEFDEEFEEQMKAQGCHYIKAENRLYVLGNDAYLQAGMAELSAGFKASAEMLQRPMKDGVLNPDAPKISLTILRELMKASIERGVGPARPGEILYFSVPANPVDSTINNVIHAKMAERYLNGLGYESHALGEGLAVVFAENPKMHTKQGDPSGDMAYTGIGISCLIPGTKIYTRKGITNIENVRVGDEVLTHKGRWKTVNDVVTKQFKGASTRLMLQGYSNNTDEYGFVDNHELYVKRDGEWRWVGCEDIVEGDVVGEPIEAFNPESAMPSMTLIERKTSSKSSVKKTYEASGPIHRLIGYFLGDGSVNLSEGCIQFDFEDDEEDNIADVIEIFSGSLGKNASRTSHGDNCTRVKCYSVALCEWFKRRCYDSDGTKKAPFPLSSLDYGACMNLLAGLIRSDGEVLEDGAYFFNTNTSLALLAKQAFSRVGIAASISHRDPRSHEFDGRTIEGKLPEWKVGSQAIAPMNGFVGAIRNIREQSRFPNRIFIEDGFCCGRVQEVETGEYEGVVYDLKVEEDHSFSGPFLTIHNCGAGMMNVCLAERGIALDEYSIARSGDWLDAQVSRMTGQPKTKVTRIKERKLNFDNVDETDKDGEILVAYDIYYDELIKYVFDIFTKRFNANKGSLDHPIDIVLSGGTASPKGFDKKVRRVLLKMSLPFEIGDIRLAGGGDTQKMLQAVAKGCYIRAKQAAKKASTKEDIGELK